MILLLGIHFTKFEKLHKEIIFRKDKKIHNNIKKQYHKSTLRNS